MGFRISRVRYIWLFMCATGSTYTPGSTVIGILCQKLTFCSYFVLHLKFVTSLLCLNKIVQQ